MRLSALMIYAMIAGAMICIAQNTMRGRNLKPVPRPTIETTDARADTVSVDSGDILFSGYDKTLRSRKESVFVTNHSGHDACSISFEIEYRDMNGRQLHRECHSIDCDLPDGQTRLLVFPSWDKQQVWYYYLSRPARTSAQGTPYKVIITPESISICHLGE